MEDKYSPAKIFISPSEIEISEDYNRMVDVDYFVNS